jgi:hypothetical protein
MIPVVMCQRSFLVFDGTLLHPLCLQFTALSLSCELLYGRDRPLFAFLLTFRVPFGTVVLLSQFLQNCPVLTSDGSDGRFRSAQKQRVMMKRS